MIETGSRPRISIVTPSFNQGTYLEQTIRSVLQQEYPDLEYIIIDGGSTDASIDIIRKYADRLTYWTSEPDRGQSHAINKGFERASGEIVAWLNSDDFYMPGALQRVADAFVQHPEVGLVYGDCLFLEDDGATSLHPSEPIDLRRMLVGKNPIWQPSAFLRHEVLQQVGGVDESLHFALDYDLWLRALKYTTFLRVSGPALSTVHDHPEAKSRKHWSEFMAEITWAVDRYYATPCVPPVATSLKSSIYGKLYFECAAAAILGKSSIKQALPLFFRALKTDPRTVSQVPWVLLQLIRWSLRNPR